jgi:RNA polymerase sigma-70 factor (ECF subfamily)
VLEEQWLRIYRETVHPLYGYMAKRTGGDRALTEDIVQESYLRALDSWKRKAIPDVPLAWLKQVARNILIDYLRRKKWDADAGADSAGPRTSADELESLELFLAIDGIQAAESRPSRREV